MRKVILPLLLILFLFISMSYVTADEHEEEDEEEEDEDESELGETFGSLTLFLLGFGFLYVILRRSFVYSRKLGDDYDTVKERILAVYRRFRKPLLNLHSIILILATITAGIHGIMYLNAEAEYTISGWIAFAFMVILSISGIIIYFRFKPIWTFRDSKTALKFIHRQWLFTVLGGIALIFHLA